MREIIKEMFQTLQKSISELQAEISNVENKLDLENHRILIRFKYRGKTYEADVTPEIARTGYIIGSDPVTDAALAVKTIIIKTARPVSNST